MLAIRSAIAPFALFALSFPGAAQAENAPAFFGQIPVSDALLEAQRAGFFVAPLSSSHRLRLAIDSQARSTERLTAGTSRVAMDVWWTSVGSEMIAINVRMSNAAR